MVVSQPAVGQATRITGTLVLKLDEAAQIADPRSFFTVNVVFFVAASHEDRTADFW